MSVRVERVAQKVKFEVARILQNEMNDPRMGFVTVVDVELSPDYRYAKVYVSVLANSDGEERRVMRMLEDACGYIQRIVAGRLSTRVTPKLTFLLDKGAEKSVQISSLLDEIRQEREAREGDPEAEDAEESEPGASDADEPAPSEEPPAPEA